MRFKLPLAFIALTTSTLSARRPRRGTSMTSLRNTLSGLPSAAAMALGFATFVPANPACRHLREHRRRDNHIDRQDRPRRRAEIDRCAGLCAEFPQARRQLARWLDQTGLP